MAVEEFSDPEPGDELVGLTAEVDKFSELA
jgi:hypothetical protein